MSTFENNQKVKQPLVRLCKGNPECLCILFTNNFGRVGPIGSPCTGNYARTYGMVWCLFIQHQRTSYIAQITQDAEREMHEV